MGRDGVGVGYGLLWLDANTNKIFFAVALALFPYLHVREARQAIIQPLCTVKSFIC